MFRKLALSVGLFLGGAMLLAFLALGGFGGYVLYSNAYKTVLQIIYVPSQHKQFVLLTDLAGFDDRSWYVYQSNLGASLTDSQREGHNSDGALFWNYSEAGEHKENPHIRLVEERFLVFTRGGLDHSLYDLKSNRVLINATNSWGEVVAEVGSNLPPDVEKIMIDNWVRENLHAPIQAFIKNPT